MNNYLLQLLKEVKTIIIPGLGALTLTNEASGEMLFMPYLKYDDGNLAKHISEKEGMDINDAKNLIAKFVREVTAELDKGNSYDMYQFGSFKKIDGDVAFDQWNSGKSNEEGAPIVEEPIVEEPIIEEPIVEEPVAIEIEEPIIKPEPVVALAVEPVIIEEPISEPEPIVELAVEPTIVPEPQIDQEKTTVDQPEESISTTEKVIAAAVISDVVMDLVEEKTEAPISAEPKPIVVESAVVEVVPEPTKPIETVAPVVEASRTIEEPVIVAPTTEKPVDLSKKPAAKQPEQPKKKRRVLGYVLWGFLVLFMGGATYVAINFNTLKKDFPILADLAGENNHKALEKTDLAKGKEEVVAEEVDDSEKNFDSVVEPIAEQEPTPEPQPEPEPVVIEQPKPVKTTTTAKKPRPKQSSGSSSVVIGKPDPSKPYHVVGGSFGSEANAKRFARELIGKGQPSVMVGEFNGMYRVSIASFSTKEEAVQAHSTLKDVVPQAWVFKWP